MMVSDVLFSSKKDEWETPDDFFAALDAEFGFTLDAAASPTNAKCANYYTKEDNALDKPWEGVVWCNPPYGRDWRQNCLWVGKGFMGACVSGATVVMLMASRTDTRWFHEIAVYASEIRFVKGKLTFKGGKSAAPFPSLVLVFKPGDHERVVSMIDSKGNRLCLPNE